MSLQFVVRAYRGGRPESATACAQRLVRLVRRLEKADPTLSDWFAPDPIDVEAPPVRLTAPDLDHIIELLRPIDPDNPKRSFWLSLHDEHVDSLALSVTCGEPEARRS